MSPTEIRQISQDEQEFFRWLNGLRRTPTIVKNSLVFKSDEENQIHQQSWLNDHQVQMFDRQKEITHAECTSMAIAPGCIICGFSDGMIRIYNWFNMKLTSLVVSEGKPIRDICSSLPCTRENTRGFMAIAGSICQYIRIHEESNEMTVQYQIGPEFVKIISTNEFILLFDEGGRIFEIRLNSEGFDPMGTVTYELNSPIDDVIQSNLSIPNIEDEAFLFVNRKNYLSAIRYFWCCKNRRDVDILFKIRLDIFWTFPLLIATDGKFVYVTEKSSQYLQFYPINNLFQLETRVEGGNVLYLVDHIHRIQRRHSQIILATQEGAIFLINENKSSLVIERVLTPAMGRPNILGAMGQDNMVMYIMNDYGVLMVRELPEVSREGVCNICKTYLPKPEDPKAIVAKDVMCVHYPWPRTAITLSNKRPFSQ